MAAAFVAMNEVFGHFFDVDPIEMFEPVAYAQAGAPRDLFVFDDQLHMVRGSQGNRGGGLRALAQGPSSRAATGAIHYNPRGLPDEQGNPWGVWNPALVGLPNTAATFQIMQFIKDVYLDSQVTVGLLSNVTAFRDCRARRVAAARRERRRSAARRDADRRADGRARETS